MKLVDERRPAGEHGPGGTASDPRVARGARTVLSAAPDVRGGFGAPFLGAAEERGWFTPTEDSELRIRYAQYLSARAALLSALGPLEDACSGPAGGWKDRFPAFCVALAAASLLLRQSGDLAALALVHPLLARKLDEASPRHGTPGKTFTAMFRASTDPARLLVYRKAAGFYENHRSLTASLADDPHLAAVITGLEEDLTVVDPRRRMIFRSWLRYRWFSLMRRQRSAWKKSIFGIFELSGRAISELRQPGVKPGGTPKRVDAEARRRALALARPGDVFITRHDDALSNLFLPGFWPHAALYLGDVTARAALGVVPPRGANFPDPCFLEAKKDGVRFRPAGETLAVDAFVVLRPPGPPPEVAGALTRAMAHEGKLYDFSFDFRNADRLACTEVVYRAYHGAGPLGFTLVETGGRRCLPAEELIAQCLEQNFRVVAACGLGETGFVTGLRAELALHASRAAL